MGLIKKLLSKIRAFFYVFKKAEIMQNIVNKEINGEYDNLCPSCYFNERYQGRALLDEGKEPSVLRLSIYLGGALGDYIVYLRFVDEISSICPCEVDLFLDRMEFAAFVFGKRENITIIHDAENCLFRDSCTQYDMALHLDHGVTLRHVKLGNIREKSGDFYKTACRIVEYTKSHRVDIEKQNERETVILRQAKFFGETKWSKLSCGGSIDMEEMYSNILLDSDAFTVLKRYDLEGRKYITVNFGADKNMGGTAQTKVLPAKTLEAFIRVFKDQYPEYLVVQTGVRNSISLEGADRRAFDCRLEETAVILKYSTVHIDSEGGLVHLASQLSTPCVVSFGPTPVYYYGYQRNENIVSPTCNDCMATTGQWSKICPKGLQVPECMASISEEMIVNRVSRLMMSAETVPSDDESGKVSESCRNTIDRIPMPEDFDPLSSGMRICIIGQLNDRIRDLIEELNNRGITSTLFIPLKLSDEAVQLRTVLKHKGFCVEYGSPLNIAASDDSFDYICCQAELEDPNLEKYEQSEFLRLLKNQGKALFYQNV